jgi:exonuclease VII large subunit
MNTAIELTLEERLRVAGSDFESVHRQLSTKKGEFDAKKTSCSQSEFTAMSSAIAQLEAIESEKRSEFTELERGYAIQLDAEREAFTKRDLLGQRQRLEQELAAGEMEIDTLRTQINAAEQRIGTLIHQRNRLLPQLALLPRPE